MLSFDMLIFIIEADLRSREELAWLMGDLTLYTSRRRVGPSSSSFSMIYSKKGNSVYMNIEGREKGFNLSSQTIF